MTDRDELVRRVAEVMREVFPSGEPGQVEKWLAGPGVDAVLDALGLTEETVWTDDGDPDVWSRRVSYINGSTLHLDGHAEPATDAELRAVGLVKKRRYTAPWEEITDDD